jgi:hypothetical protein
MSIFASQTKSDPLPIPFDPPHWIVVRKLTGTEVEAAQAADAFGMASGGARTWATRLKRMAATGDPRALAALSDPLVGYDRLSMIRSGLLAWSYPQSVTPIAADEARKVEASDAVADLDDEATDFIAREILRLTKPGLFTEPETEQKKADGSSSIA